MSHKKLLTALTAAGALAIAPASALAATETVTGTTTDSLSVGVSTAAAAMTNFTAGNTATTTGVLAVTATGNWYLKVLDSSTTTPGKMDKLVDTTCLSTDGDASLTNALSISADALAGTDAGAKSLSGTATTLANGSLSDTVNLSYSQVIPVTQKMKTGCIYSVTATYSVSATA